MNRDKAVGDSAHKDNVLGIQGEAGVPLPDLYSGDEMTEEWFDISVSPPRWGYYRVRGVAFTRAIETISVWTGEQFANTFPIARTSWAYIEGQEDEPLNMADYILHQCAEDVRDYRYAVGRCGTLCRWGCFLAICVMAHNILLSDDLTLVQADQMLGDEAYTAGCLLKHSVVRSVLGIGINTVYSVEEAIAALDEGHLVGIEVAGMEHFVLAHSYSGTDFLVLDSLTGEECWLSDHYDGADSFRIMWGV